MSARTPGRAKRSLGQNFLVDPKGRLALIRRGPVDEDFLREQFDPIIGGKG